MIGYFRLVLVLSVGILNNENSIRLRCCIGSFYPWDFGLPRENFTPSDVYSYVFTRFTIFPDNKITQNFVSCFESSFSVGIFELAYFPDMLIRFSSLRHNFFSGAFPQSRKAPVSFVTSVRLFVRLSASIRRAPIERISMKFDVGDFCEKSIGELKILIKSDKNIGHFTWRIQYILSLPAKEMRHESIFKK